jgi:hypothetical protein
MCWGGKINLMKITFIEDIVLALRRKLDGRVVRRNRFKQCKVCRVEFLGEDLDRETIDFRFDNGLIALGVTRHVVALVKQPN